jgi:hypothetical protein
LSTLRNLLTRTRVLAALALAALPLEPLRLLALLLLTFALAALILLALARKAPALEILEGNRLAASSLAARRLTDLDRAKTLARLRVLQFILSEELTNPATRRPRET